MVRKSTLEKPNIKVIGHIAVDISKRIKMPRYGKNDPCKLYNLTGTPGEWCEGCYNECCRYHRYYEDVFTPKERELVDWYKVKYHYDNKLEDFEKCAAQFKTLYNKEWQDKL